MSDKPTYDELKAIVAKADAALTLATQWAAHLFELWQKNHDVELGKGLRALEGSLKHYAPDADIIHAVIAEIKAHRKPAPAAGGTE